MPKATNETLSSTAEPIVESAVESVAAEAVAVELPRDQKAMAIVNRYAPWTAVAGILPLPLLDMAALMAAQLHMLSKISKVYDVPFKENTVKGLVTTLLSTLISTGVGTALGTVLKGIPLVGSIFGFLALPGMYSAATYAIGRIFVTHFEAGGTFLDFDAEKMRTHFVAEFEKAKAQPDLVKAAA